MDRLLGDAFALDHDDLRAGSRNRFACAIAQFGSRAFAFNSFAAVARRRRIEFRLPASLSILDLRTNSISRSQSFRRDGDKPGRDLDDIELQSFTFLNVLPHGVDLLGQAPAR